MHTADDSVMCLGLFNGHIGRQTLPLAAINSNNTSQGPGAFPLFI